MITSATFSVKKGRIYATITRDSITEGERIDIRAVDATKYLPSAGLTVTIDLTPYILSSITGDFCTLLNGITEGEIRYFNAYNLSTQVDFQTEDNRNFYMYEAYWRDKIANSVYGLLTRLPYMQVAHNGSAYDSVIICANGYDDDSNHIAVGDKTSATFSTNDSGVIATRITPMEAAPIVLNSTAYAQGDFARHTIPLRSIPRGMNTRRLIWRNELGGIDSWYFEALRESSFATTSDVFYSANGYTRTNRQYERQHIVETRELDDLTADVVAYVIASPEVYLYDYDTDTLTPIDIVTEECRTYSDTKLTAIQVAYRLKERERV